MNPQDVRAIFESKANSFASSIPGPHPGDNDELLTRWSRNLVSDEERQQIIDHLSRCSQCRMAVADMVKAGVLTFSNHDTITVRRPQSRRSIGILVGVLVALAASIALIVVTWPKSTLDELDRAERELAVGDSDSAFRRLHRIAAKTSSGDPRLTELLEKAGYQSAREKLRNGRFDESTAITRDLAQIGVASARLKNLQLQAEHQIPAEYSLASAGALIDYEYGLDGRPSPAKAIPSIGPVEERRHKAWQDALALHPNDPALRLNYGEFLLSMLLLDEARQEFRSVMTRPEYRGLAVTGLGLADFMEQNPQGALGHFESAVELRPDDLPSRINLAIALEAVGRRDDAKMHWQRASELETDADRRKVLESRSN